MEQEGIPGLTLYVHESAIGPCAAGQHKGAGTITLTAEVDDFEVWDKVVQKLDGMRVHSVQTLAEALVRVAQVKAATAEQKAAMTVESYRGEIARLESQLAFAAQSIGDMKRQLQAANDELVILRDFATAVNANARRV
jgi:hypothetical protein